MKIVIPNPFAAHDTTVPGQSPIISDQDLLFNTLREASVRASQQQRAVLASYTQPIERYDTIQPFNGARQAGLGECFFWEQPAEQNTLIGIGATTAIETMGSTCFIDSASAWRSLLNHAVIPRRYPLLAVAPSSLVDLPSIRFHRVRNSGPIFPLACSSYPASS